MAANPLKLTKSGLFVLAGGLFLGGLAAFPAGAQTLGANSASFNAGYGRLPGQENRPVSYSNRDANGNLVMIDGIIQSGVGSGSGSVSGSQSSTGSSSSSASASSGAGSSASGVGASGGASAVANNLTVITQGNNNTVIVTSTQVNHGNVTANTIVRGTSNAQ